MEFAIDTARIRKDPPNDPTISRAQCWRGLDQITPLLAPAMKLPQKAGRRGGVSTARQG